MCWGLDFLFFLAITCSYVIVLRSRCMDLLQQIYIMKSVCTPDKKHVRKYLYIHIYINLPHICCCCGNKSLSQIIDIFPPLCVTLLQISPMGSWKQGDVQTSTWVIEKNYFSPLQTTKISRKIPSLLNHISTNNGVPRGRLWHHGFDGLPDLMFSRLSWNELRHGPYICLVLTWIYLEVVCISYIWCIYMYSMPIWLWMYISIVHPKKV